ncbi:MAG: hypothetical protein JST29_09785 [Bacteroidetes bacterium]|nr:hypothetical protein [Bacteroidota bacterium]MBS1590608.1 hypothetical protein [Bacteroidota bacterium]
MRKISLVIALFIIITKALSQDESQKLKDNIRATTNKISSIKGINKSIVEIKDKESNAKEMCATGFLIKKGSKIYLLTNKHVICKEFNFSPELKFLHQISLMLNFKDGNATEIEIPILDKDEHLNKNILVHPERFVDIAAIDVTDSLIGKERQFDICATSFEQIIPVEKFQDLKIKVEMPLIISGFPFGIHMQDNFPISSQLMLAEPIKESEMFNFAITATDKIKKYVNSKYFKAIGDAFKGMSGAPIIILKSDYPTLKSEYSIIGIASLFDDNNKFLFACNSTTILETFTSLTISEKK